MAFHDDLLQQSLQLVHNEPKKPKQASLRRAVSTAYYALFHFLIGEAVANWKNQTVRSNLARAFDHGQMKSASNRMVSSNLTGQDASVVDGLKLVARAFITLQEKRLTADYDSGTFWSRTEALSQVKLAEQAFAAWRVIRQEQIAQAYLVSLLVKPRG